MKYFSYGSNMSIKRIKKRVPSAKILGITTLKKHKLLFHKISKDGSGKCDAFFTNSKKDIVVGVLYDITKEDKKSLDKAEGLGFGYDEKQVELYINDKKISAVTYIATKYNDMLKPYDWYKKHVLTGANDAGLPVSYIKEIKEIKSIKDMDIERKKREMKIYE